MDVRLRLRYLFAVVAILLVLALGSVACGGGDDDSDAPQRSGQEGEEPSTGGNDSGDDGDDGGGDDDEVTDGPTIPPNLGEELSAEDYFAQLDQVLETADAATEAAQTEVDAALAAAQDLDTEIAAIQSYLATELEVFSDAIGRLDALNPPDDLEGDHDDFLAAIMDAASAASDLQFELDGAATDEEANILVGDFEETILEITERSDAACSNLQAAADAAAIAVDLNCEE
jgi:hypothetical protein